MNATRLTLVSLGEAVYDVFPAHRQLGGAPLNLSLVADQLLRSRSGISLLVTRIGQDDAGRAILDELRKREIATDFIQTDPDRPTGSVIVSFDDAGEPTYEIVRDTAWDAIQYDPDLDDLARQCDAVAFGTLAQRDAQTRNTIYRFLDAATHAIKLVDINLRQDYFDRQRLNRSLELATIAKMNHEELPRVAKLLGISGDLDEASQRLRERYKLEMVAITRGADGVRLYHDKGTTDGEPAHYDPVEHADSVGAGDACAAGLLVARLLRQSKQQIADLANRCGAFVVSQPGGTPKLPDGLIASV